MRISGNKERDEGWLRMWWKEVSGLDPSSSARPATRPTLMVDLDTQESEEAPTQMDATAPPIMPMDFETLGDSELALIDAMLADQQPEDAKKKAQKEFAHQESLRTQEAEDAGQWLDAYGIETVQRRAVEVAAKARAEEQPHTPATGGRKWTTQVEAFVQQGGVTIGKRARWQLEINETRPLMVQFQIEVRGAETDTLNAKSITASMVQTQAANTTGRSSTVNTNGGDHAGSVEGGNDAGNDVMGKNGGGGTDSTGNVETEQDVKPGQNVRGGEDGGSGGSGS